MGKPLHEYNRKRNFNLTTEPLGEHKKGGSKKTAHALKFVIQKHDARRLHYDFRLEMGGTLKSWAVPKGPSLDPKSKRLAVHVEDHPIDYATFEGSIPHGQYGGGDVIIWDQGVWKPHEDPVKAYKSGKLKFTLIGEKLSGDWTLVHTQLRGNSDKEQWLLIKERDESARAESEYDITEDQPQSVITGKVIAKKNKVKDEISKAQVKPSAKKNSKLTVTKLSGKSNIFPKELKPELATLVNKPPEGDWLYEIKFDGYRILTRIQDGKVNFFTRNGHDWTERLPKQADAIAALNLRDSWLDGEVVVLNEAGLPSFQALQNAFDIGRSHDIIYYLFDAPYLNGQDIRSQPVEERRAALEKILSGQHKSPLRFSAMFTADHESILSSACYMGLEGVIGKRVGSEYVSRRSDDWIKLKCRLRQEFIVVGYTLPQGSRSGFGALLVAVYDHSQGKPQLRYAGRVGTGFNQVQLNDLSAKLKKLERDSSPLDCNITSAQKRGVKWVDPKLVCEAEFAEWTGDDILRQAAFISLRTDKPAKDIIRERTLAASELVNKGESSKHSALIPTTYKISKAGEKKTQKHISKTSADDSKNSVVITHPERVIDTQSGFTKQELADFYRDISDWIVPHLKNRPVSLMRAPEGLSGQQFFQKHAENLAIPHIHHLDRALDPRHAALMEINNLPGLLGAVQMGTIELHTWGATSQKIELPDRITLDLDPDPELPWRSMVEATRLTLAVLDELKLDAYLKTSGGKGMHIIIPLTPKANWDDVKKFSKAISEFMAAQIPERFSAKMGPQNRIGKIFIDYLRNSRGASTVSAYSVRARPGLPVSVPITHDELTAIKSSAQWNLANLRKRLHSLKIDPWEGYHNKQLITPAMWQKLGARK